MSTTLRSFAALGATLTATGLLYAQLTVKSASCQFQPSPTLAPYKAAHVDVLTATMDAPVDLAKFASCFFRSPVFQAERVLLRLLGYGATTDAAIARLDFEPNDAVVVFRVVERTPDEVVLAWALSDDTRGHSWLHVADDGRSIEYATMFEPTRAVHWALVPFHLVYARVVLAAARYQYNKETVPTYEP
ncbi:hypothetical protein SPRG_10919 [Saprolegnia parasitica CBS 223.65]|uniref:DUF1990 domain-containing protein n=1 Tax=Saprolegnia parasitica (strain CBS 223.65) TaxID=695850 RepID=A0A067C6C5_SAPPC|nr:hypothetical protein SPRG_10919 [Saprolegnia parasitica CBS 223.65]KDO22101.1 hypothetical protein SPRG_10919 [Saprolegnia parasitica CBS 223.65]|eukprot:XP_012207141.1 hypothetical protein SPRG_10919 [Saprolegnia parasitica CBS 223.65]